MTGIELIAFSGMSSLYKELNQPGMVKLEQEKASLGIMFCTLLLLSASFQLFYDYLGKGMFFLRTLVQNSDVNSIMHLSKSSKKWHVTIFLLHLKT